MILTLARIQGITALVNVQTDRYVTTTANVSMIRAKQVRMNPLDRMHAITNAIRIRPARMANVSMLKAQSRISANRDVVRIKHVQTADVLTNQRYATQPVREIANALTTSVRSRAMSIAGIRAAKKGRLAIPSPTHVGDFARRVFPNAMDFAVMRHRNAWTTLDVPLSVRKVNTDASMNSLK